MNLMATVAKPTMVQLVPRFEGSNICTWIGFKHLMYLVEEAVLCHFRQRGLGPRRIFEEHGLCLEIVDSSVRIFHALHMDDLARIEVEPAESPLGPEISLVVRLFVERGNKELKASTGTVKAVFRRDSNTLPGGSPAPLDLSQHVVERIERGRSEAPAPSYSLPGRGVDEETIEKMLVPTGSNAYLWRWHIPYFYCHFSERIQHSGYLRLMEEVVDRFLANRGISIRSLLDDRRWIPVVPDARLEIYREALMEETIYTVYSVEQIFKDVTYTARMDCYVVRDGGLLQTATGVITHGYAEILDRSNWRLVHFDERVQRALRGPKA